MEEREKERQRDTGAGVGVHGVYCYTVLYDTGVVLGGIKALASVIHACTFDQAHGLVTLFTLDRECGSTWEHTECV